MSLSLVISMTVHAQESSPRHFFPLKDLFAADDIRHMLEVSNKMILN